MILTSNSRGPIGVLLSGGLDSSILLAQLLSEGCAVQPFYVRSHLHWEAVELRAARRFLDAVACPRLRPLVTFEQPLDDVYGSHWSVTGCGVPDAATPDEAVYLPGRNALLILKPSLWCQLNGIPELALAQLGTNPFADATPEFFARLEEVLQRATGQALKISTPFGGLNKRQVMQLGRSFPLETTFSCIDPVDEDHCGACNKCAERQAAFRSLHAEDPTDYAAVARRRVIRSS